MAALTTFFSFKKKKFLLNGEKGGIKVVLLAEVGSHLFCHNIAICAFLKGPLRYFEILSSNKSLSRYSAQLPPTPPIEYIVQVGGKLPFLRHPLFSTIFKDFALLRLRASNFSKHCLLETLCTRNLTW